MFSSEPTPAKKLLYLNVAYDCLRWTEGGEKKLELNQTNSTRKT